MARDADRGAGTRIIANYAGIASLHTLSTRVEAVYASGRLATASRHVDIAVAAGTVSCRGIKLLEYNWVPDSRQGCLMRSARSVTQGSPILLAFFLKDRRKMY